MLQESILQYFRPSLSYHLSLRPLFLLFLSGRLRQVLLYFYTNFRFLQSDFYKASKKTDDIAPYLMFEGVKPDFNEVQKLEALARGIDNMNVNVYSVYNSDIGRYQYLALNDFWKVYEFFPNNLTTIGHVTAPIPKSHVTGTGSFEFLSFLSSAHPLPEVGKKSQFTFVSSVSLIPGIKSKISLVRILNVNKRQIVAQWPVDKVPYMHSFSVTEHYVIFFASPFYVNTLKMIKYAEPIDSLDWHGDEDATVYVVNIKTGHVTPIKTNNMFTMHHVNAFEESETQITVDLSSYPSPAFVQNLKIEILRDPIKRNQFDAHALLKRYRIDLETNSMTMQTFESSIDVPFAAYIDMPTLNEEYRYNRYCKVYGIVLKKDNITLSKISIAKKDLCGNIETDKEWFIEGHYPVESWFVATPGGTDEDDGYLLVPILDGYKKKTYLATIDAKSMKTINRAYLPTVVPFSLHGRFFEEVY